MPAWPGEAGQVEAGPPGGPGSVSPTLATPAQEHQLGPGWGSWEERDPQGVLGGRGRAGQVSVPRWEASGKAPGLLPRLLCPERPCAGSAPVETGTCQGPSRAWMPVPSTWEDRLLRPESQAGGQDGRAVGGVWGCQGGRRARGPRREGGAECGVGGRRQVWQRPGKPGLDLCFPQRPTGATESPRGRVGERAHLGQRATRSGGGRSLWANCLLWGGGGEGPGAVFWGRRV